MTRTILITGSSRGIGRAIAELAHGRGYTVVVHGQTDSPQLNKVHKDLKGSLKAVFDVADKTATEKAIGALLKEVGVIDSLVNNAGINRNILKDIAELDDDKALEEYRVNVLGAIHCIQAVLPKMLEKGGGSVVNISSIKGYANLTTLSTLTYATTKAGVISLTKGLAKAYPAIRFNAVAPGYTETDMAQYWDAKTYERINNGTVLGRIGKPHEIASLVLFLVSDEASYITGSDFLADGGYSIQGK